MRANKKIIVFVVVIFAILLGTIVLFQKNIQSLAYSLQPCSISFDISQDYANYSVKLTDIDRMKSFLNQIGNCQQGQFTIYPQSTKTESKVKKIIVRFQTHPQLSTQKNNNGIMFGFYSYVENDIGILVIQPTANQEGYKNLDNYLALTITRRLDALFNQESVVLNQPTEFDILDKIGLSL